MEALGLRLTAGEKGNGLSVSLGKANDLKANRLSHAGDEGDILDLLAATAKESLFLFNDAANAAKIYVKRHFIVAE
jgi:hypothetical protein